MKSKFEMHSFQFHYFLLVFFFDKNIFLAWVCIKNFIHLRVYILSNYLPDDSKHLLQLIGPCNEPTNGVFGIV